MELPNEIKHGIWLLWVGTGIVRNMLLHKRTHVSLTLDVYNRRRRDTSWDIIGFCHNRVD